MAKLTKKEREDMEASAEDVNIISETKDPVKPNKGHQFSIAELEEEIDAPAIGSNTSEGDFAFEDPTFIAEKKHNPFAETIIENESDANKANRMSSSSSTNTPPVDFAEPIVTGTATPPPPEDDKKTKTGPVNPNFDDMSGPEKRKQVEMFADAILTTYGQFYQKIFSWSCSINMGKMEILDKDGVLRLSMIVSEDGLTVKTIFENFNEKVSEVFKFTDEMREELREPLIMVLMEKGIAPTPLTSLLIILGKQTVMGIFAMFELRSEMKQYVNEFKEFRKQEMAKPQQAQQPADVPNRKPDPVPAAKTISMDDVIDPPSEPEKKKKLKQPKQPGITIDEVLPNE